MKEAIPYIDSNDVNNSTFVITNTDGDCYSFHMERIDGEDVLQYVGGHGCQTCYKVQEMQTDHGWEWNYLPYLCSEFEEVL
jgi:hypothetical protein